MAEKTALEELQERADAIKAKASGSNNEPVAEEPATGETALDQLKKRADAIKAKASVGGTVTSNEQPSSKETALEELQKRAQAIRDKGTVKDKPMMAAPSINHGTPGAASQTQINNWVNRSVALLKDAESYYDKWSGAEGNRDEEIRKQSVELMRELSSVKAAYAGNEEAISYIDSITENLMKVYKSTTSAREYYSQWDSQEAYDQDVADYQLEQEVLKMDASQVEAEVKEMEAQLNDLQRQLDSMQYIRNVPASASGAIAQRRAELGTQISQLEEQLQGKKKLLQKAQDMRVAQEEKQLQEEALKLDLEKAAREIEDLEDARDRALAERQQLRQATSLTPEVKEKIAQMDAQLSQMEEELRAKKNLYQTARDVQGQRQRTEDLKQLESVSANADFKDASVYDASYGQDGPNGPAPHTYEAMEYDHINGQVSDVANRYFKDKYYDQMKPEEVAVYNYYLKTQGTKAARTYLDSLQGTLNERYAENAMKRYQGKTGKEIFFGAKAGWDQAVTGLKNLDLMVRNTITGQEGGYIAPTGTQILGGMIRDDLNKNAGGLASTAYDVINTSANMLPSILTATAVNLVAPGAGSWVGAAMMGGGAAGNAYQEVLNLGYSQKEAAAYGTAIGISEAALEKVLGGIGALGGTSAKIAEKVAGIENGIARFCLRFGGKIGSEALEEGLQSILEPGISNWMLDTDKDVDWSEVAYSALLGGLTGGVFGVVDLSTEAAGNKINAPQTVNPSVLTATPQTPTDAPQIAVNKTGENGVPQTQTPATDGVAARNPIQKALDVVNSTVAQLNGDPANPLGAAVTDFRENGTVSNKLADAISRSPDAVRTLVDEVGLQELPRNASEKRAAIKQAVMDYAEKNNSLVDNQHQTNYDETTTTVLGGNTYAEQSHYAGTTGTDNDFARIQEESRSASFDDIRQQGLYTEDNETIRTRLSEALGRELERRGVRHGNDDALHLTSGRGQTFDIVPVDANTFHDIFEVARKYTKHGELVDLHSVQTTEDGIGYEECANYLSADGMSGFSITPDGDLISVFNADASKKGFLRAIAPVVKAKVKTLDCYMSQKQPLQEIYERVLGMKVAAVMDHNVDYDHDNIAANHNNPKVAFMVNSDSDVETRYFDKEDYDGAKAYQLACSQASTTQTRSPNESVGAAPQGGYGGNTVGGAQSQFKHEQRKSKVYENTYANATDEDVRQVGKAALEENPHIADYDYISEKESLHNATLRTRSQEEIDYEYDYLLSKDGWTGEDNDTAKKVLDYMRKNGDIDRLGKLAHKQRKEGTQGGQLVQSFAKYTRTPAYAADSAIVDLSSMKASDVPSRFYRGTTFEAWKGEVAASIVETANQIDSVKDGDTESMKDIIRSLANFRHTTAMFGWSSNLTKLAEIAMEDIDFQTAKDIATAQLSQITNDFRKRSVGQVVKTLRIHNMLSSIATINRNLVGNTSVGMVDAVSDSTVGRALDALVSLFTGKRTVGNDVKYAKAYFEGASKAAKMAALCAELDIPMEPESRYSTGKTRTYSPQGGPVMRFMSAYEKYMKYALEVTDKFFEGGTNAAVDKSLNALGEKANLSQKEIAKLSEMAGQRRTFKDDRKISKATKGVKKALNELGSEHIGLGDLAIPFAGTGSNVTQTAIDYTGGGVFSGLYEIAKIAKDVKNGKPVDAVRQRQAVTNAARSVTGVGLIAAFAALAAKGIIMVHDDGDKDERALDQALGLSGAQFNVDAMLRAFAGKDTEWQDGDWTVSIDFMEPFNAQMYVGYLLSQEESVEDMVKKFPGKAVQGVAQSILDMPMMQNLSDTVDLASGMLESVAEGDNAAWENAAGQLIGNYGSSFVPAWVRQTAYMADPYYRDTTGGNTLEKSVNQLKSNIPGLSQTLPKKYSGLGEEQLRHDSGVMGFFNTYINPGKISQISTNKIADSLDRISAATNSKTIYPDYIAPGSFSYTDKDGKKQTVTISGKEMTETYQKTYGENVSRLYGELISMGDFDNLEDEVKASILEAAKSYATQLARASVSDYSEIPAYIKDKPNAMGEAEAIVRQKLVGTTKLYTDLSIPKAAKLATMLKGILPEQGYTNARTIQKIEAVTGADSFLSEKEQRDVLEDILPDETFDKYVEILAAGYSSDDFATAYRIDLDIEGEGAREKTIRAFMKEFGTNRFAATKLYDLYHPKKEP